MNVHTNIPLKNYLTMRLGGNARFMTDVSTAEEMQLACHNAVTQHLPFFILGGGSNVIATDEGFAGFVIHNRIMGFEVVTDDASGTVIKIGGGENWDEVVSRTVEMGLSGIEAMSAIPGTAGAAQVNTFVRLENADCGFSYRHSIFRGDEAGRYAITSITLRLVRANPQPPFYESLQKYFDEHAITLFTPKIVRDAVMDIRTDKLPDPAVQPNTGSFFKNAVVEDWQLDELRKEWPDIPAYDLGDKRFKVPTGWLIEQAGLKGQLLHGMRVHDKNALVLINETAASYHDLAAARDEIIGKIRDTFRIMIEQEPLQI
jgi:UDP-N-acetylmuramate dehydrogenase